MSNNDEQAYKLDVAMREWELSKYTTQELKDELERRDEFWDVFERFDVCKHDMEMGYCEVKGCAGSY